MHASPPAMELGIWFQVLFIFVGAIGGIVGIAVGCKRLFERRRPEDEYVTRSELSHLRGAVDRCLTKQEFSDFRMLLEKQQEKLENKLDENGKKTERLLAIMECIHLAKKLTDQPAGGIVHG